MMPDGSRVNGGWRTADGERVGATAAFGRLTVRRPPFSIHMADGTIRHLAVFTQSVVGLSLGT